MFSFPWMNKKNSAEVKKIKKKSNDIVTFVFGWVSSFISVSGPIFLASYISSLRPELAVKYGDKIAVVSYLISAFFSGLFMTYRVYIKGKEKDSEIEILSDEKDNEIADINKKNDEKIADLIKKRDMDIEKLSQENKGLKAAFDALSPKERIIKILTDLHYLCDKKNNNEILKIIIKKISEVNEDSLMNSNWDGVINYLKNHASFDEFNKPKRNGKTNEFTYNNSQLMSGLTFKNES